jgi:hypothetical protein
MLEFFTAFWTRHAEMSLQKEVDKNKKTEPNLKLEDLIRRIHGAGKLPEATDPESLPILKTLQLIRQKALLGIVDVFGCNYGEWRLTQPVHWEMVPKHPIPKEHWVLHEIDCSEFLSDRLGLVRDLGNRTGPTHIMLSFDRSQVDTIWPPRRRLEWRWPFKLSEPT